MRHKLVASTLALLFAATGCKSTQPPAPKATPQQAQQTPSRPTVPPPAFKVFHHTDTSITLVTKDNATDEEIKSLIWQIRDAAQAHSLDKLKIDQKFVDNRKPIVWFHIYRGAKCASEKYASGAPPCGGSYHAAGDYTFGGYQNPNWDDAVLLHDEKQTPLWNPDAPYTAPSAH